MTELIVATRNAHKVAEMRGILAGNVRLLSQLDFPGAPAAVEDAGTFAGNAAKKAEGLAAWLASHEGAVWTRQPLYVLADDSGLEVDALNGAPGVYSARFADMVEEPSRLCGPLQRRDAASTIVAEPARLCDPFQRRDAAGTLTANSPDSANNAKLLRLLEGVPPEKRAARFRCVLALAARHEATRLFEGHCEGRIAGVHAGAGGFGYDPLFIPEGFAQSFAELGEEVKNKISHRARALAQLRRFLDGI
jgi:XTP/dITP diphosphohydrolase